MKYIVRTAKSTVLVMAAALLAGAGAANADDAAVYSDNAVKNTPCTLFHNR